MTIAFVDGPVITSGGRLLEHATVLVENDKIVGEGKIAGLILVTGNPLDDIDILLERESVHLVMQGGNIVANHSD
jgi:hypothetical protein